MKRLLAIALMSTWGSICLAQSATSHFMASTAGGSRMDMVRSSVEIPTWHEKTFWPIYEDYAANGETVSINTSRSLEKISKIDRSTSFEESLHDAEQYIQLKKELLDVRRQYYHRMATSLNGIISLQFLQTELLLDMVGASQIYDGSRWGQFRFHPTALSDTQLKNAKRNMMTTALQLTKQEAEYFWPMYEKYEEACDRVIGNDYSVISLYAGDPSDFTPALAKRLGTDLITLLEREDKLREEYFYKFRNSFGPNLAARFLAWEDFYSLTSKMYAWADAP